MAATGLTRQIRSRSRRLRDVLLAVIAACAVGVAGLLLATGWLKNVELITVDARFDVRGAQPPPDDVVVVGIDDRTFDDAPSWPFPRSMHADVIEALAEAKAALVSLMRGEQALLARFASLIETFDTPNLGVLSTLMVSVGVGSDEIDIKKAGIFPIVHGVRTLALERGIPATATAERIEALTEAGALEAGFGRELVSALRVFMEYRLRSQLEAVRRGDVSREALVRPSALSPADRDILRDALRIVRQFRERLRARYRLVGAF